MVVCGGGAGSLRSLGDDLNIWVASGRISIVQGVARGAVMLSTQSPRMCGVV